MSHFMKLSRILAIAVLGVFVFIASAPVADADRQNRRVKIINETSFDMVRFYGSNVGTDDWEEDILGKDILRAGRSVTINFDDGTGYCMYDFKAVFDDGDEVVARRKNVCELGSFRFTD